VLNLSEGYVGKTDTREDSDNELLTVGQFAQEVPINPGILLTGIVIIVDVDDAMDDLASHVTVFTDAVDAFIRIYTTNATSLAQLPPGDEPLIDIYLGKWDSVEGPEEERLYEIAWKTAVCGRPMDFFNPAVSDRPRADYMRM
jgi:hypothetical protein